MDINEMIAQQMNVEPILNRSDIKAIALANISNTLAVNASKGRTVFMSSIAKDVNAAQSMAAGGLDLNMLLMMNMFNGGGEAKKPDSIEATLNKVLDRLDDLENVATRKGK